MLKFSIVILVVSLISCSGFKKENEQILDSIPPSIAEYISSIEVDSLSLYDPIISVETISDNIVNVRIDFEIKDTLRQDDWKLDITPNFEPNFHWSPHLTPTEEHIISDHVFRAPALIVSGEGKQLIIIPDIGIMKKGSPVNWYMDMDAENNKLSLGLSKYKVKEHVLFVRDTGAIYPPGKLEFGFTIMVSEKPEDLENPWRRPLEHFWKNWGKPLYESGEPIAGNLDSYVEHTYNWAFNTWRDAVWQEFELNGKKVGAPVFIVNVTQSPNYSGEVNEREFRSIWNQAWFSSLRSASGLYRYARRARDNRLLKKAKMGKELALAFLQRNGFFDGLIATEMESVKIGGRQYNRSKGWETHYFGNSNRNPVTYNPKEAPLHILDMSWTAKLMLDWYTELEKDQRLLDYANNYANALLKIQDTDGFFPAWLDKNSLKPLSVLDKSPETSMSITFLLELYDITGKNEYKDTAIKAMKAIIENIIHEGRWEDFETYWSCSRYGADTHVGKKFLRNNMYKQNNFSIYWTAEALLKCYKVTNDKKYLRLGQRTLDELLMYQASWQPAYMYIKTLGGFGVMNVDGEWNDSRQSLFAELIIEYGRELKREEYIQRGLAALKSSFVMMYCPENPITKEQWEKKYDFFKFEDYGFMMENYGHTGDTDPKGLGIGPFTIYDWGNGAASEAYNRIVDHYGIELFENK